MKLSDLLIAEMSRANTDYVAGIVRQKPELFDELMELMLSMEEPVARRAAWVVDLVSEEHPSLIKDWIVPIIDKLPHFDHDGLKRHATRILSRSDLPEDKLGSVVSICFDWLVHPEESVAVKVHCMDILFKVTQQEPDLKNELIDAIEFVIPDGTPGLKNRGRKLLDRLYRMS